MGSWCGCGSLDVSIIKIVMLSWNHAVWYGLIIVEDPKSCSQKQFEAFQGTFSHARVEGKEKNVQTRVRSSYWRPKPAGCRHEAIHMKGRLRTGGRGNWRNSIGDIQRAFSRIFFLKRALTKEARSYLSFRVGYFCEV